MVNEFNDIPCVVKFNNEYYKVEKPKKFFNKHREMENENVEIHYIDSNISGMKEVALALQTLEDSLKGITRIKQVQDELVFPYKYRININTVLEACSEEDLNNLKKNWVERELQKAIMTINSIMPIIESFDDKIPSSILDLLDELNVLSVKY